MGFWKSFKHTFNQGVSGVKSAGSYVGKAASSDWTKNALRDTGKWVGKTSTKLGDGLWTATKGVGNTLKGVVDKAGDGFKGAGESIKYIAIAVGALGLTYVMMKEGR